MCIGASIRSRVINFHRKQFETSDDAEVHHGLDVDKYLGVVGIAQLSSSTPSNAPTNNFKSPETLLNKSRLLTNSQFLELVEKRFQVMNIEEQKSILDKILENVNDMCMTHIIDKIFDKLEPNASVNALDKMFAKTAECSGIISKPVYYASSSIDAMLDLQNNYKPNLMYKWPKCINRRNEKEF